MKIIDKSGLNLPYFIIFRHSTSFNIYFYQEKFGREKKK